MYNYCPEFATQDKVSFLYSRAEAASLQYQIIMLF